MAEPLYVDANIFVAMVEHSNERAGLLLRLLSSRSAGGRALFLTSELTLAELLVAPIRNSDDKLVAGYEDWRGSESVVVAPVDRGILRSAATLRASVPSRRLPDAIHVATAALNRCRRFLTYDKRLAAGLQGLSPAIDLVSPDESTARQLIAEIVT